MAVAYNIFPLTIYHTSISDNDYLKELLVPKIEKAIPELEIPKHWATDNLRTSFESEPKGKEIFTKENNSILIDYYNEAITELFDKEVAWEIVNGIWYNYYEKDSYQERHEHIASPFEKIHFSCVHYLSYDKKVHTATEFRDPISALRAHSLTLDRDFVGDYFMPTVEEGDLIMFPAYLEHRIFPQKVSNTPRITLSFNFEVTKYG
tara:strand:- start:70 stop:687 length:618 start_codon:yes stop_codon:yes gene_type:complete